MGKTILITGASTGLGAAMAQRLAHGNRIIVHYHRSQVAAEKVAAAVNARGGTAELVAADLSCDAGCEDLALHVTKGGGVLDVLINNAGGMIRRMAARDLTWDFLIQTFALNTFSAMRMSALCIPFLERGTSPCIILLTSIAQRHGAPTACTYGASKGALGTFTRGLAKELAPRIRVNAIAPGVIATPFHDHVTTPEQMRAFAESAPLKRTGTAEDIASAAEFIINNEFLTGATIDVNGGLYMY